MDTVLWASVPVVKLPLNLANKKGSFLAREALFAQTDNANDAEKIQARERPGAVAISYDHGLEISFPHTQITREQFLF